MELTVNALRMGVASALCVAALAAGCGDDDDTDATTPSTTAPTSAETPALEGRWQTDPVTLADMEATLRDAGLEKHFDTFERNAPISDAPTELILDVGDDWDLYGHGRGEPQAKIDYDAYYEVKGDTVVVTHSTGTSNTLRWSIRDDVLELTWLEGDAPPFRGTPDELYQRALYMAAEFHRTGG